MRDGVLHTNTESPTRYRRYVAQALSCSGTTAAACVAPAGAGFGGALRLENTKVDETALAPNGWQGAPVVLTEDDRRNAL